ncbi:MAG TPA: RidA family protein [Paenirhodobacter sp.]
MTKRIAQTPILHRVVEFNGVLHFSGITATDYSLGMKLQTEQLLARFDTLLTEVGSDRTKVLTANIYLSDFSGKAQMNEAWCAFFDPQYLPSRATLGVNDLGKGCLIEVVFTAHL